MPEGALSWHRAKKATRSILAIPTSRTHQLYFMLVCKFHHSPDPIPAPIYAVNLCRWCILASVAIYKSTGTQSMTGVPQAASLRDDGVYL
ncbi:hypothetical protein Cob_v006600 [Colletotrichum orbiculare MAFF 240422]|uniref:Uncharacterized protein n=1 Tax=Colletotrichum orbiculare (strain 104-T / ATCC 96160 / CBS 514.97 / LARS 414 / MAFF 240422) TaxID=1213857 RepID=A0A484FQH7_COLOR|nr:hypothetical protein Cob_v006600 [Colletotrichum orbiculare MAFF 240422]